MAAVWDLFFTTEDTEAQKETSVLYPFYARKKKFFGHKALSRAASGSQLVLGSLTAHLIHSHRLAHKRLQRATQSSQLGFWMRRHGGVHHFRIFLNSMPK